MIGSRARWAIEKKKRIWIDHEAATKSKEPTRIT